jgi:hypothetical protein
MDHGAVHRARQYIQTMLTQLEAAELERDAATQSNALGLAGRAGLDAVNLISAVRRELNSSRRSAIVRAERDRDGVE